MTPWKRKFPLVTINFQIPCEFSGVYSEGFIDMLCHQLLKKCETNNKKHKNNIPHRFLSKGEPTTANSIFSCFPCFKKHVFLCAPSSLSLVSTICIIDAQFFGFLKCLQCYQHCFKSYSFDKSQNKIQTADMAQASAKNMNNIRRWNKNVDTSFRNMFQMYHKNRSLVQPLRQHNTTTI